MSSTKKEEEVTKRPSIHSAREQKQNRMIIIGFIITAALIIGMIGYALFYDKVFKNYIPVAKVDNKKIDNDYFLNRVRLERNAYIQQYNILYAQYQMFADQADYQEYFVSQLGQIQSVLDDYESFGKLVLDNMVDDQVIAIEAEKAGVEVSEEEIDQLVMELFNYYPSGTPTPEPTSTPYSTPTVSKTQQAILGYTPTPAINETEEVIADVEEAGAEAAEPADAAAAESNEVAAVDEVAETVEAETPEATVTPTEIAATGTPSATATPYTEELYQETYKTYIADLESINVSETYLREYIYHYLLNKKMEEKISAEVPVEQEQVWARHILVETEEEAKQVLTRLNDGEDWNVVAADVSIDTSNSANGGDLGWFPRGYMVEPFEEAAFALNENEISQPVETDFGWHIIQVVGHEVRLLSAEDYTYAQQTYYQNWITEIKAEKNIKINDVWKDIVPQDPTIPEEMLVS
jgi:peptidyl-prolyl cis-trans isomerase D